MRISLFHIDINECTTNVHNCDQWAACNNTIGSFNCTCFKGYEGNGTSCAGRKYLQDQFLFAVFYLVRHLSLSQDLNTFMELCRCR